MFINLMKILYIQVCTERGWREYTGDNNVFKDRWNLWWKSGGFSQTNYKSLLPWQVRVARVYIWKSICMRLEFWMSYSIGISSLSIVYRKEILSAEKTISWGIWNAWRRCTVIFLILGKHLRLIKYYSLSNFYFKWRNRLTCLCYFFDEAL